MIQKFLDKNNQLKLKPRLSGVWKSISFLSFPLLSFSFLLAFN